MTTTICCYSGLPNKEPPTCLSPEDAGVCPFVKIDHFSLRLEVQGDGIVASNPIYNTDSVSGLDIPQTWAGACIFHPSTDDAGNFSRNQSECLSITLTAPDGGAIALALPGQIQIMPAVTNFDEPVTAEVCYPGAIGCYGVPVTGWAANGGADAFSPINAFPGTIPIPNPPPPAGTPALGDAGLGLLGAGLLWGAWRQMRALPRFG